MEFRQFTDTVQSILDHMPEQKKTYIIMEMARTLPETKREEFLDFLEGKEGRKTVLDFEEIEQWCVDIEEGEIYFDTEEEEYYEEGAWERDFRTRYLDKMHIIPKLVHILDGLHEMVFQKEYKKAYQMLCRICGLSFMAISEWYDDQELSLWDLIEEQILLRDQKVIEKDLLYSCCQSTGADRRGAELYGLLNGSLGRDVNVTDLLTYGPEAVYDADAFMEQWVSYLRGQTGGRSSALLEEACIYQGGVPFLKEIAMADGKSHPYLITALCERYAGMSLWQDCMDSAVQGLKLVSEKQMIRGDIADYGARAAGRLGQKDMEKMLAVEAFRSKPVGMYFLRIFLHCDAKERSDLIKSVCTIPVEKRGYAPRKYLPMQMEEARTEIASEPLKQIYLVMLGDFETGYGDCKNDEKYLGWSGSFQRIFISLMLQYFRKENGMFRKADASLQNSIRVFLGVGEDGADFFQSCFQAWKSSYVLSEEQRKKCLELLHHKVDERTKAIVGGGHRHSYGKAAELIVVMGEIDEEMGTVNGTERLAEYYRKQNSRKSAFRAELQELLQQCGI